VNTATGEVNGKHPQAFTHHNMIHCAHVLETLKRRRTRS